jgi:hypothetical protein
MLCINCNSPLVLDCGHCWRCGYWLSGTNIIPASSNAEEFARDESMKGWKIVKDDGNSLLVESPIGRRQRIIYYKHEYQVNKGATTT